jgi:nucleotide-binding universal stress UspA family protein
MPDMEAMPALPRRLLLATDLSCRCDRALDRAVALCRDWRAELFVVHALETPQDVRSARTRPGRPAWHEPKQRIAAVERQLRRDLAEAFIQPTIVVEEGEPADLALRTARDHGCDLIVVGVARDETFGRLLLGGTGDALIRSTGTPLLVVKNRVHGRYGHLVVATDFSADSRAALRLALRIQPRGATLFHAFDVPFAGWTEETQYLAEAQRCALEDSARFLDESGLPEKVRQAIAAVVGHGTLSDLLQDYVQMQRVDLILLGLPERGFVMETLIGSRARAVVDLVSCDILLVPDRSTAPLLPQAA